MRPRGGRSRSRRRWADLDTDHDASMIAVMDPAIIVAIIGAAATIVAAFIALKKEQSALRNESSSQHGVLADLIRSVAVQSDNIYDDLQEVKTSLKDHLASHDKPETKPAPRAKKAAKKVS